MKKILTALLLTLLLSSGSYGANSDDIYVRKDMFNLEMKNLNNNMERILNKLDSLETKMDAKFDAMEKKVDKLNDRVNSLESSVNVLSERLDGVEKKLNEKIDGVEKKLSEKIDGVDLKLSARIDGLDMRISDLRNGLYLVLVLLSTMTMFPFFKKWYGEHKEAASKKSPTTEEIERIIERLLDARLSQISFPTH